jgi:hypothetical protein
MLDDALTVVSWRSSARSFVSLMALYESNYVRLGWIAGRLAALAGAYRSAVDGDCELRLTVVERSAYTTTAELTYALDAATPSPMLVPDLRLRIYHDARLAEAQAFGEERGARSRPERELDHRWRRNVMLNKWLEYCRDRGHRLVPDARDLSGPCSPPNR